MAKVNKTGYVLIYRSLLIHWIWPVNRAYTELEAWLYLLMKAAHTIHKERHEKRLVTVYVGDYITNAVALAKLWGWDRRTVGKFLKMLEKEGMIQTEKCTRTRTRIKVTQYPDFQGKTDSACAGKCPRCGAGECTGQCTEIAHVPSLKASQALDIAHSINKGKEGVKKDKESILLPVDFSITKEMKVWAVDKLGNVTWLEIETEKFIVYFQNRTEKRSDWIGSWKIWMLRNMEKRGGKAEPIADSIAGSSIGEIDPMFKGSK